MRDFMTIWVAGLVMCGAAAACTPALSGITQTACEYASGRSARPPRNPKNQAQND